jgi:hypothetical protein
MHTALLVPCRSSGSHRCVRDSGLLSDRPSGTRPRDRSRSGICRACRRERISWRECEYVNRDDVPDVFRHDIGDEEVDVVGAVDLVLAIAAGVDTVSALALAMGGLDLNAPGAAAVVEDEVVAVAVAPGFGDGEAEGSGLEEESGFGDFAAALGGETVVG